MLIALLLFVASRWWSSFALWPGRWETKVPGLGHSSRRQEQSLERTHGVPPAASHPPSFLHVVASPGEGGQYTPHFGFPSSPGDLLLKPSAQRRREYRTDCSRLTLPPLPLSLGAKSTSRVAAFVCQGTAGLTQSWLGLWEEGLPSSRWS